MITMMNDISHITKVDRYAKKKKIVHLGFFLYSSFFIFGEGGKDCPKFYPIPDLF